MPSPRANVVVFWVVQVSSLLALAVPPSWSLVGLCAATYLARMLGITLGFHRHFAHRSFELPRPVRFVFALLGTAAMQKGPLWWAGNHVSHHRFADREGDPHSPARVGFYRAHIGWFLDDVRYDSVPEDNPVVRAFSRYPEIRFLDRFYALPPLALAVGCYALGGLPALVWGFCVSTTLPSPSTRSTIFSARGGSPPPTTRATTPGRHSSPWAKAGTTTTIASRGPRATVFTGGNGIPRSTWCAC